MSPAEEAVRRYYALVDVGDVDGVLDCFAEDAVYHRPGYAPMEGRAALGEFYGAERVIADGAHVLDHLVVDGRAVAVRGRFEGRLKDGSAARVGFADFWLLDDALRATTRHTYFEAPAV